MRVRMHTESGSVYGLDMEKLTWERVNRIPIRGLDRDFGTLEYWPTLGIGQRAELCDTQAGFIATTRIVRLELTDE